MTTDWLGEVRAETVVLHGLAAATTAPIDHVAIGPAGVWVIAEHRLAGRIRVADGALTVAGQERTDLVRELTGQVEQVRTTAEAVLPDVPMHGALCFPGGNLPLRSRSIAGILVLDPLRLVRRLNGGGPVTAGHVVELAAALRRRLPAS